MALAVRSRRRLPSSIPHLGQAAYAYASQCVRRKVSGTRAYRGVEAGFVLDVEVVQVDHRSVVSVLAA